MAGSDTSANTLAFACYQLAKNPEIQEKLRNEINYMFDENPSESLTYEDLQKMQYLEQVICETLRFHNLTGTVQRVASNDYRLDFIEINTLFLQLHCRQCDKLIIIRFIHGLRLPAKGFFQHITNIFADWPYSLIV